MKTSKTLIAMATAVAVMASAGCEDNSETNTSASDVVSNSIITTDISNSIDPELNNHNTSKPLITESSSSSTTEPTPSEPTTSDEETSEPTTSSDATSEPTDETSSSSNSSSSSQPTGSTSTPSSSSSTGTTSTPSKPKEETSKPSSSSSSNSSSTSDPFETPKPTGFYDKNGNPLPADYDLSKGGFYNQDGNYIMTPEEKAAWEQAIKDRDEAIENGTYDGMAGATQEDFDWLASLRK